MKAADGRHLRDDQMIAVYVGAEPRFGRRNKTLDHLHACPTCARRYHQFVHQMADVREEAVLEADAVFTPARLEAQREQILARLEHIAHPARVIQFPAVAAQNLTMFTGTQVRRWIAAAAAAGLIIGLSVGRMVDFHPAATNAGTARITAPATTPGPVESATRPTADPKLNDEELLSRAEQVQAEMPLPASLEAIGAMTPITEVAVTLPPRGR